MKIRPVAAELLHGNEQTDGRTDGQTDMNNLIVTSHNNQCSPIRVIHKAKNYAIFPHRVTSERAQLSECVGI